MDRQRSVPGKGARGAAKDQMRRPRSRVRRRKPRGIRAILVRWSRHLAWTTRLVDRAECFHLLVSGQVQVANDKLLMLNSDPYHRDLRTTRRIERRQMSERPLCDQFAY